jgi:uncharacterized protein YjeT (DUF2065 family)
MRATSWNQVRRDLRSEICLPTERHFRTRYIRIASPDPCGRARHRALAGHRPGIIVLRASAMGTLASEFFKSGLFVWFAGALLLFGGLLIIAFHQYWSNLAAVLISLFGWILALRGLVLMAAPELYERAAMSMDSIPLVRLIFGVLVAFGLYLTYVGWIAKPASPLGKEQLRQVGER